MATKSVARAKAAKRTARVSQNATTGERKTPPNTPMRPGLNGGMLKTGNPGNAGGGRRPAWIEDWCDEVLSDATTRKQVVAIMGGETNSKAFAAMWRTLAERAHGKPTETVEVTAGGGLTIRVVHE